MTNELRTVVDTGVVVSALLLPHSVPRQAIDVVDEITVCRDAKDNSFLELAVSGKATHIVTGDTDLLVLHPFRGVAVVTPQSFLAIAAEWR